MYENDYAEVYDLVMRSRGRDYAGEAGELIRLIRRWKPDASSLLDVACGTGLHLQHLAEGFARLEGLDFSEDTLALAKSRVPGLRVRQGDMRDIGRVSAYDAITCMFAVPHLDSAAELTGMVASCVRALTPGGVLVIEPWFSPEQFIPGYVSKDVIEENSLTVMRISHSTNLAGRHDRMRMVLHSVLADPEKGLRHSTEHIDMSLFTREDYAAAFATAGCRAEYIPPGLFTWGLWVAQRGRDGEGR